jgi:serine/threonine protein kinase
VCDNDISLQYAMKEGTMVQALQHDNIVEYLGMHHHIIHKKFVVFLVMEYCAAGDLNDFIGQYTYVS